jgi:endonuclease YncB( thermonuclease family)
MDIRIKRAIVIIIFILTAIIYYNLSSNHSSIIKDVKIIKITDGDTLETETGAIIRLKGINTPEKNTPFYEEAKSFLELNALNKTSDIEVYETDKYGRLLSYVFISDENINNEIVKQGLAHIYFYEEQARLSQLGIWKSSPYSHCINITLFKTSEPEQLILKNICNISINLIIKDDATHLYKETISQNSILEKSFSHIWNDDGDTLFIWDESGRLISFYRY